MDTPIEQLSIRSFVALLLKYTPKTIYTVSFREGDQEERFEGTYEELLSAYGEIDPLIKTSGFFLEDHKIDYKMPLEETTIIKYLRSRTDGFDPDLTIALLSDIENEGSKLFDEIKATFQDSKDYEKWYNSSTSSYNGVMQFLKNKCKPFENDRLFTNHPSSNGISNSESSNSSTSSQNQTVIIPQIDNSPSERLDTYRDKAVSLFPNGKWHNNNRLEYAIFHKVLYCIVYRKEWDRIRVSWIDVAHSPLANGTYLSSRQLTEAMKSYSDVKGDGLRRQFEELLMAQ